MDVTAQEQTTARLELAARVLALIYALASVAWLAWLMIPEHRRRLMAMRLAQAIRSSASSQACRSGQAAMRRELRSGRESYQLPYALSLTADAAGQLYERARYVT